jgi:hypothetical protein
MIEGKDQIIKERGYDNMRLSRIKKMMLFAVVFVFSMVMGMMPASASEVASGTFGVTSTIVDGKVVMTVKAYNVKSMAAVQLDVAYDTETLTYESYAQVGESESAYVSADDADASGVVTVAYIDGDAADATAEGTALVDLTFAVKEGVTATTTPVTLSLTELYGEATEDTTKNRADEANADVRTEYGDPTDAATLVPAEAVDVELPQAAVVDEEGTFVLTSEIVDGKVQMTVKAVNVNKVASVQLDVAYDTDTLTYESYTMGATASEESYVSAGEKEDGVVTIAYIDNAATDADAEGTVLAVLTFAVNDGVTATTTDVTVTLEELYGEATEDTTKNRADAANADVRAEYGDPEDVADLVPAEAVEVALPEASTPSIEKGNVDGKEGVTLDDALYVLERVLNKRTFTAEIEAAADVDGKAGITLDDALYVLEKALGKRASL